MPDKVGGIYVLAGPASILGFLALASLLRNKFCGMSSCSSFDDLKRSDRSSVGLKGSLLVSQLLSEGWLVLVSPL